MTTDPRALIAEGRKHDEAMSQSEWKYDHYDGKVVAPGPNQYLPKTVCELYSQNGLHNGNGIAWLRTNLAALLDGYASALDEVDALRGQLAREQAEHVKTHRDRVADCNDLEARMQEIGEQALVIEQQDRDMARLVAGLREALAMVTLSPDLEEANDRLHKLLESTGAPCTTTK